MDPTCHMILETSKQDVSVKVKLHCHMIIVGVKNKCQNKGTLAVLIKENPKLGKWWLKEFLGCVWSGE